MTRSRCHEKAQTIRRHYRPYDCRKVRAVIPELDRTPMPDRIARLPRDPRGYPIPYFVADLDPIDFRKTDARKRMVAAKEKRCHVCGEPLGYWFCFVTGPIGLDNRITSEGPLHEECAEYACRVCPFIVRPKAKMGPIPEGAVVACEAITERPERVVIATVRDYQCGLDPRGVLHFRFPPPKRVRWFRDGEAET